MTTTVMKSGAIHAPRTAAAPRSRGARRRVWTLAVIILTLAAASIATWLTFDRLAGSDGNAVSVSTSALAWTPITSPWLGRLNLIQLKRQLVRAGYSLEVDGNLDPVAKSALADFLRIDAAHPLSPSIGGLLEGTVITGKRDPQAWNSRFGLNRATKFVERPLTGPGGQLDANGNLRDH
jgi:hypothetical protein